MSDRLLRTHSKKQPVSNLTINLQNDISQPNSTIGNNSDDQLSSTTTSTTSTTSTTTNSSTTNNTEPKSIQPTTSSVENRKDSVIHRTQILDPFSVIVNLAILSYKPINTKISIASNCIHIQEIGIFQSLVRYLFSDSKFDLPLLYNPIECAGKYFLDKERLVSSPKIKHLFERALKGIENLCQTYADDSVIKICLNYYISLIQNFLSSTYNNNIFKLDTMTRYYNTELVQKLNERWTPEKLQVVIEMNEYLMNGSDAAASSSSVSNELGRSIVGLNKIDNIMCMEIFMRDINTESQTIIYNV